MPDKQLVAFLSGFRPEKPDTRWANYSPPSLADSLSLSHLGIRNAEAHRLRLYTDAKHIPGGTVYRVVIQHPTKDQIVRYLPGDNAAQVAQTVEQHLHLLWNKKGCVVSCSEYDVRTEPVKVITDRRMGF